MKKKKPRGKSRENAQTNLSHERLKFYKYTQRDLRNNCRVGEIIFFRKCAWIIAITTHLSVFLINERGHHLKLTWQQWRKEHHATHLLFKWNKKVMRTIRLLKERINTEYENKKHITRKPAIKRTPVKKEVIASETD